MRRWRCLVPACCCRWQTCLHSVGVVRGLLDLPPAIRCLCQGLPARRQVGAREMIPASLQQRAPARSLAAPPPAAVSAPTVCADQATEEDGGEQSGPLKLLNECKLACVCCRRVWQQGATVHAALKLMHPAPTLTATHSPNTRCVQRCCAAAGCWQAGGLHQV